MRQKAPRLADAKLVVMVVNNRQTWMQIPISVVSVFDNRTQQMWTQDQIAERGLNQGFLDIPDMRMSLNWNLNGDESKYQCKWGPAFKNISLGAAYIYD